VREQEPRRRRGAAAATLAASQRSSDATSSCPRRYAGRVRCQTASRTAAATRSCRDAAGRIRSSTAPNPRPGGDQAARERTSRAEDCGRLPSAMSTSTSTTIPVATIVATACCGLNTADNTGALRSANPKSGRGLQRGAEYENHGGRGGLPQDRVHQHQDRSKLRTPVTGYATTMPATRYSVPRRRSESNRCKRLCSRPSIGVLGSGAICGMLRCAQLRMRDEAEERERGSAAGSTPCTVARHPCRAGHSGIGPAAGGTPNKGRASCPQGRYRRGAPSASRPTGSARARRSRRRASARAGSGGFACATTSTPTASLSRGVRVGVRSPLDRRVGGMSLKGRVAVGGVLSEVARAAEVLRVVVVAGSSRARAGCRAR